MPSLGGIIQGCCFKIVLYIKQNFTPEGSYPVLSLLIMLLSGSVTVIYMTFGKDFYCQFAGVSKNLFAPVNKSMLMMMMILKTNLGMLIFGACLFVKLGLLNVL